MPGRSNLNANCVDTEQIIDGCITSAKFDPAVGTSIAAAILAAIAATAKVVVEYVSIDMTATGTTVTPICTIPSMAVVTDVFTFCEVAQTGNGTMTIGDGDHADGYMIDSNIAKTLYAVSGDDPATRGIYLYTPGMQTLTPATPDFTVTTWAGPRVKFYAAPTVANVTNVKGTNSTGQMGVYLIYKMVTPS